jgi:phytanoyl-CoA hydroxylase
LTYHAFRRQHTLSLSNLDIPTHSATFDVDLQTHSFESPSLIKVKRPHLTHAAFKHIIHHPAVLNLVKACLLADRDPVGIRFQGDKLNIKPANSSGSIPFHQDWEYFHHTNDDLCTVSIPLAPMSADSGSIMFLPYSHTRQLYSHHDPVYGFIGAINDSTFDPEEEGIDIPECNPGSILIHHSRTIHGSPDNRSGNARPLRLLQYAATDAWPLQQNTKGAWGVDRASKLEFPDEWDLFKSYSQWRSHKSTSDEGRLSSDITTALEESQAAGIGL